MHPCSLLVPFLRHPNTVEPPPKHLDNSKKECSTEPSPNQPIELSGSSKPILHSSALSAHGTGTSAKTHRTQSAKPPPKRQASHEKEIFPQSKTPTRCVSPSFPHRPQRRLHRSNDRPPAEGSDGRSCQSRLRVKFFRSTAPRQREKCHMFLVQ